MAMAVSTLRGALQSSASAVERSRVQAMQQSSAESGKGARRTPEAGLVDSAAPNKASPDSPH
jgi:hypothetical protein